MKASRIFSLILVVCLVGGLLSGCGKGQENVLKLYNYGDYMSDELLKQFEKETGIRVRQDTFDTNEDMYVPVANKQVQYDLIICGDYTIEKMIKNDLLQPLNYDNIPNAANLDKDYMAKLAGADPGNKYAIPYTWGTVGILYNTKMVEEPVDSWGILWNEKYAGKIWMYDSVRDTIGITLKYLGYDFNTRNEAEVNAARDLLIAQAPLRKGFGTDNMRTSMVNNKAALAVVYSGDAVACIGENEDLAFVVPKEGSNVWFDNVIIPKNAKNVDAAHAFINFLNDAENATRNTEYIGYTTPNKAALDRLGPDYTEDETYNPPQEILDRCEVFHDLGEFVEVFNAAWDKIKASK